MKKSIIPFLNKGVQKYDIIWMVLHGFYELIAFNKKQNLINLSILTTGICFYRYFINGNVKFAGKVIKI